MSNRLTSLAEAVGVMRRRPSPVVHISLTVESLPIVRLCGSRVSPVTSATHVLESVVTG